MGDEPVGIINEAEKLAEAAGGHGHQSRMVVTLVGRGRMPSWDIRWPRNWIS